METVPALSPFNWVEEMEDTFRQLQKNTVRYALPGLLLASFFVFGLALLSEHYFWLLIAGFELIGMIPLLWYLSERNFLAASIVLILGSFSVVLNCVWGGHFPQLVVLLVIPTGLALLNLGTAAGVVSASINTLLILVSPFALGEFDPMIRYSSLVVIWYLVGVLWLALRPLLETAELAWTSYNRSQVLLDEARDYQKKLGETLQDLTQANAQLVRLNQLANGLRQIAEDERRAKEQFVANVSHELRTPLNMIIGYCEMILKTPQTYGRAIPSSLLADLQVVLRNSQHLTSLIDDVLDLSQIESGQMALMKERVDIAELIRSASIAVQPLFKSKHLSIEIEVAENLPKVYCDLTRIRQVFLNLLSNAGRFTEKGGVRIRAYQEASNIMVSVADTGPGIPEDAMRRLFQPFQQADSSIRRKYGGTGLGLSLSKNFVELHDGKMWFESQEGHGTTFYVRLPIDPVLPQESGFKRWINPYTAYPERSRTPKAPPVRVRPRILVVEHGDSLQRLLSRYQEEMEVVAKSSIDAAVEDLSQTPAKALLINSFNVVNTLQGLLEVPSLPYGIPVIVCSIPGPVWDIAGLNIASYLVKPVSRDALIGALDRLGSPIQTILLVDDEPDVQQLFRRMLSSANRNYRVLRADDGQQALNILSRQKVDVILLDLLMPEMDGFQFISKKSQDCDLMNIPVILISARDPLGHPIISNALAVTRSGGLSAHQLLECIQAISAVLSPIHSNADLRPLRTSPD